MFFDILNQIRANFFSGIVLFRGLQMCFFFCVLLLVVKDAKAQNGSLSSTDKMPKFETQPVTAFKFGLSYHFITDAQVKRSRSLNKIGNLEPIDRNNIEGEFSERISVPLFGISLAYVESSEDSWFGYNLIIHALKSLRESDSSSNLSFSSIFILYPEFNFTQKLGSLWSFYEGINLAFISGSGDLNGLTPSLGLQFGFQYKLQQINFLMGPQIFHGTRLSSGKYGQFEESWFFLSTKLEAHYYF